MDTGYARFKEIRQMPRLPLSGNIDLTYRCNNNCLHCWLRIPLGDKQAKRELSFEEIKDIVNQAREMGCQRWAISGGEPMLRPEFPEIFDYITTRSVSYSINTNGTLITPKIAKLLKRKGTKMVALYGATAEVHDRITRSQGSFEAAIRGFRYLKEAGAGFTVQIIPMKDNYHQYKDMVRLAESLSRRWRIGAPWLFLSACREQKKNKEIIGQRLAPKEVIELDKPDMSHENRNDKVDECPTSQVAVGNLRSWTGSNEYLFSSCIAARRDFHIDPYGRMTFCCFIKSPELRYSLRKGSFKECWEKFIPSLARKVKVNKEYSENCGSCKLRRDCRFCPVYGYLEHGRFSAKVGYLCKAARENKRYKDNWRKNNRRYYKIADITIRVDSDLPINEKTFHPKLKLFEVDGPGKDNISIRHYFKLPELYGRDLGRELYRKPPWAIYQKNDSWIYLGISPRKTDKRLHKIGVFNIDYTSASIYSPDEKIFLKGGMNSLTAFPTDQILLAQLLADREGCYLHSSGVSFNGKGLLFIGHSGAGKSTMAMMLKGRAKILCDDRVIIRRQDDGFKIYGTWSHGDVPDVSPDSAPLKAIMFLKKAKNNQVIRLDDKKEITKRLLECAIRPFITADWWEKTLAVIDKISCEVLCYTLKFDKSGKVADLLKEL